MDCVINIEAGATGELSFWLPTKEKPVLTLRPTKSGTRYLVTSLQSGIRQEVPAVLVPLVLRKALEEGKPRDDDK